MNRSRVLKLIELAVHPGTPPHEAAAAAMAACRRIHEEGLLSDDIREDRFSSVRTGDFSTFEVAFLVLGESDNLYRLAKVIPPRLQSEVIILLPKEYVREVTMMTKAEKRKIGWSGMRVIKRVSIVRSYFDHARANGWDNWW